MRAMEYCVCLFTFVAIQYVGIEVGMLMGILGAMVNFVYSYAKKSNVTVTALRFSTAVRTFEVGFMIYVRHCGTLCGLCQRSVVTPLILCIMLLA